jgi:hypothetical protein
MMSYVLIFLPLLFDLMPITTYALPNTLQLFQDKKAGIVFCYPTSLVAKHCPSSIDNGSESKCISCLDRKQYSNDTDCYATVEISTDTPANIAITHGWRRLLLEDLGNPRFHDTDWSVGNWLVPSRGIPEPARAVSLSNWTGMTGTGLRSITDAKGVACSACGTTYTAILSDGNLTVIINYVTEGAYAQYDKTNTFDVMLQTLVRTGLGGFAEQHGTNTTVSRKPIGEAVGPTVNNASNGPVECN